MVRLNKKGWIKIVEAFFAAVLVIVVVILVINRSIPTQQNEYSGIYNSETYLIRAIQLNNSIRAEILSSKVPVNYDSQVNFPQTLRDFIDAQTPDSLTCEAQLCQVQDPCTFWGNVQSNIYVQDTLITANFTDYNPVKLKIYCWSRNS